MTAALFLCTLFITLYGRILGIDGGIAAGLSIKNLLLGLCLVSIGISLSLRKEKFEFPAAIIGPFLIVVSMAAASIALISVFSLRASYSETEAITSLKAKLIDPLLMLFIGYFAIQSKLEAIKIFRLYTIMIGVGCALTVVDTFNIPDLGIITVREEDGRAEGFIGSAAEFATIIAASIPILFYGTSWHSASSRLLVYMSAMVMFTCIIIAATRAPVLGLICAWLVYVSIVPRKGFEGVGASSVIFVTTVFLLLLALSFTPYWSIIKDRFLTGVASGNMFDITSGRTLIWSNVLTEMWKHPESFIIGMGWDVYFQSIGQRYATHNIYLDRFYSIGIFGLVINMIAYLHCIRMLLTRNGVESTPASKISLASGLCLIVFLVSAMFADIEIAEFYVYAIVGVGLRYTDLQRKQY